MKQNNNLRQPRKQGFLDLGQLFFHTKFPFSPEKPGRSDIRISSHGTVQGLAHRRHSVHGSQ